MVTVEAEGMAAVVPTVVSAPAAAMRRMSSKHDF
jgi:hypothetical protein